MTNYQLVFFGNERLATGTNTSRPVSSALKKAGYHLSFIEAGQFSVDEIKQIINRLKPTAGILVAYGKILPNSIIDLFPAGIINLHPSLLPAYRGPTPIETAILDGVKKTGVSLMKLVAEMDAGPVIAQETIKLSGNETKQELADKLGNLGAKLIIRKLPDILSANAETRQQHGQPSYTKLINKSDGLIDWEKPAEVLEREIRAYAGWPGSRATFGKVETIVTAAAVIDTNGQAGGIYKSKNELIVYCGHGSLVIEKIKPVGKKEMSASEFMRGYAASAGF